LWRQANVFSELERTTLAYAEAIARSDQDVDERLFASLRHHFADAEIVELACWICLEDFYSKFNRTFRIEAQGFCLIPQRPGEPDPQ